MKRKTYATEFKKQARHEMVLPPNTPSTSWSAAQRLATLNESHALQGLVLQRGVAVKDYLAASGLPPGRLFLGAVKAVPPDAKSTPRAKLNLATP